VLGQKIAKQGGDIMASGNFVCVLRADERVLNLIEEIVGGFSYILVEDEDLAKDAASAAFNAAKAVVAAKKEEE